MTLNEAIKYNEEMAKEKEEEAKEWHENQVRKFELIRFAEMDYTKQKVRNSNEKNNYCDVMRVSVANRMWNKI